MCGHGHRLEIHGENVDRKHARNVTVVSRTVGHGAETDVVPTAEAEAKITGSLLEFTDNRAVDKKAGTERGYPGFAMLRFIGERLAITYNAVEPVEGESPRNVSVFSEEFVSAGGDVAGPCNVAHRSGEGFLGTRVT